MISATERNGTSIGSVLEPASFTVPVCVCVGWRGGACFVLIRRRGGQACGQCWPAPSAGCRTWPRPIAFPRPRGALLAQQTLTAQPHTGNTLLFPNREHPRHTVLGSLACVKVCWDRFRPRSAGGQEKSILGKGVVGSRGRLECVLFDVNDIPNAEPGHSRTDGGGSTTFRLHCWIQVLNY